MPIPRKYTESVVVPLPTDTESRAVIGDSYDPDQALNVIKMMAGTEDMYPALVGMVNAIFGTPSIDDKHREMIILRSAAILDVPYEWQANEKMARNAGLSSQEIQAAASDGPVEGIDQEYVLICAATDELLRSGTLTDKTLRSMLRHVRRHPHPQVRGDHRVVQPPEPVPQRHPGATRNH